MVSIFIEKFFGYPNNSEEHKTFHIVFSLLISTLLMMFMLGAFFEIVFFMQPRTWTPAECLASCQKASMIPAAPFDRTKCDCVYPNKPIVP